LDLITRPWVRINSALELATRRLMWLMSFVIVGGGVCVLSAIWRIEGPARSESTASTAHSSSIALPPTAKRDPLRDVMVHVVEELEERRAIGARGLCGGGAERCQMCGHEVPP
jgi:hypothetical protein